MHDESGRPAPARDAQLLDLHAELAAPCAHDAAIEGEILGLPRDLRLQIADGARHFRLLPRPADALVSSSASCVRISWLSFSSCSICTSNSVRCCATARRS